MIDLDPQATLSMQFFTDKIDKNKSIIKLFNGRGISLKNIIQNTNFNNIDIIVGNEEINKSTTLINTLYNEEEKYLVADYIFKDFQEIFNSYDYVLIDYPPTMQELALNFLIISDLVVIPINNGIGSYKGLLDLKNSLNHICRKENREVPKLKIILNNVKEDEDTILIYKTLEKENLINYLSKNFINHSRSFVKTENNLNSIWTNPYYWRQKQAYEELIKEII